MTRWIATAWSTFLGLFAAVGVLYFLAGQRWGWAAVYCLLTVLLLRIALTDLAEARRRHPAAAAPRLLASPHEPAEACEKVHCHFHGVDEWHPRPYRTCHECGHVYATRAEVRRTYLQGWNSSLLGDLREPHRFSDPSRPRLLPRTRLLWLWIRIRFTRTSRLGFCQHCAHDW